MTRFKKYSYSEGKTPALESVIVDSAVARMRFVAIEVGNEALEQAMSDLDIDCMRYLKGHPEV